MDYHTCAQQLIDNIRAYEAKKAKNNPHRNYNLKAVRMTAKGIKNVSGINPNNTIECALLKSALLSLGWVLAYAESHYILVSQERVANWPSLGKQ